MKHAQQLILGNILTYDTDRPYAEAMAVLDGKIIYVGAKDVAERFCDASTVVHDYGTCTVYPGFMDAHCHGVMAGQRLVFDCKLTGKCMEDLCLSHLHENGKADYGKVPDRIREDREKFNSEYYQIVCLKIFIDGVVEAHTASLIDEYCDQPGYHGVNYMTGKEEDFNKDVAAVNAAGMRGTHLITLRRGRKTSLRALRATSLCRRHNITLVITVFILYYV